jgi:OOP family OmpA-OmpF porin
VRPRGTLASSLCALFAATTSVSADPQLEASGFVGVASFADDTQLGNSWAPEQVPNTAPVLGARVGWLAAPRLASLGTDAHLALGLEGELTFASAFTGGASLGGGRMSYFAPVFGWRIHTLVRIAGWERLAPHLVVGGGGATVASSSPFMSKESDPIFYYGLGTEVPIANGWNARIDVRHGLMPSRTEGPSSTFEVQLGLATTFGPPAKQHGRIAAPEPLPDPRRADESDRDGDGIPDHLDMCPDEKETVNGIADGDGCPEQDPDNDGIIGAADKCPDQPEDFDMYEDNDGCPDPDNDDDGIDDTRDVCPGQPETRNGYQDADGCPDDVPPEITKTLAIAGKIQFAPASARLNPQAQALMDRPHAMMRERGELRLVVIGHPPPGVVDAAATDLAKRRAEALKWHLVDQGLAQDRIVTVVGPPAAAPVELTLGLADTGIAQPRPSAPPR